MTEQQGDGERQHASVEDFLTFFQMGGVLTLADARELSREEVEAALVARERYDAIQAVLRARAHKDPEGVYSVVDGGEALRAGVLRQASDTLRAAWKERGHPVRWEDL